MQQLDRCDGHIAKYGHVREQVEMLEHHSHLLAVEIDVGFGVGDVHPVKQDTAAGRDFQQVEGTEQR